MKELLENITFFNILNLVLGIFFGILLMFAISFAIVSIIISKKNKNKEIRNISINAFNEYYTKNKKMKDSIINSLIYEVQESSKLIHYDKKYPMYELSINDIINGLLIIQNKLKKIAANPLFKDLRNVHISKILSIEENIAKPIVHITSNKSLKLLYKSYQYARYAINFINPLFYLKKLINYFIFKKGKKNVIIICLDFIGNCSYEIYERENNLQN